MLYFLKNGVQGYQKWQSVRSTSQLYVCQPYQTRVVAQQSFQFTLTDLPRTCVFVFTHLQNQPKLQIERSIFGPWLYGSLLQPFISNRGLSMRHQLIPVLCHTYIYQGHWVFNISWPQLRNLFFCISWFLENVNIWFLSCHWESWALAGR